MTHRAPATTPATEDGKPVAGKRGIRVAAIGNGRGAPSWNEVDNTFEFTLATETPCRAYRWNPRNDRVYEVDEVLLMSGIRNVAGLVGNPILNSHRSWDLRDVLGVIEDARVEGDVLVCRGRLDTRPEIADIRGMVANGILRNMSVGFDIESDDPMVIREQGERPLVEVTEWSPIEGSIVPIPADANSTIRSGAPTMTIRTNHVPGKRAEAEMTDDEKKALAAAEEAAKKEEEAAEEKARSGVLAGFRSAFAALEGFLGGKREAAPAVVIAPPVQVAPPAAVAGERDKVVAGLRSIATKNGRGAEFDALALDAEVPIAQLREMALLSVRTSTAEIQPFSSTEDKTSGQGGARLLTFHEAREARAAKRAGRN